MHGEFKSVPTGQRTVEFTLVGGVTITIRGFISIEYQHDDYLGGVYTVKNAKGRQLSAFAQSDLTGFSLTEEHIDWSR